MDSMTASLKKASKQSTVPDISTHFAVFEVVEWLNWPMEAEEVNVLDIPVPNWDSASEFPLALAAILLRMRLVSTDGGSSIGIP
jgi:hypothetical protein